MNISEHLILCDRLHFGKHQRWMMNHMGMLRLWAHHIGASEAGYFGVCYDAISGKQCHQRNTNEKERVNNSFMMSKFCKAYCWYGKGEVESIRSLQRWIECTGLSLLTEVNYGRVIYVATPLFTSLLARLLTRLPTCLLLPACARDSCPLLV